MKQIKTEYLRAIDNALYVGESITEEAANTISEALIISSDGNCIQGCYIGYSYMDDIKDPTFIYSKANKMIHFVDECSFTYYVEFWDYDDIAYFIQWLDLHNFQVNGIIF